MVNYKKSIVYGIYLFIIAFLTNAVYYGLELQEKINVFLWDSIAILILTPFLCYLAYRYLMSIQTNSYARESLIFGIIVSIVITILINVYYIAFNMNLWYSFFSIIKYYSSIFFLYTMGVLLDKKNN